MAASPDNTNSCSVAIVGGGPGGLAVSQQLCSRNIQSVIIEKGASPGWMWSQTYESLCLHTGKHLSSLPGMPFPKGANLFPTRSEFLNYMTCYAERFHLPLRLGVVAQALERDGDVWRIETNEGRLVAQHVVIATGIMSSPVIPSIVGAESYAGKLIHSSAYRSPAQFAGQRVLVVGIGNSAAEIAAELAEAGAKVVVSVRSGANNVPRSILGVPSQYLGWAISWLPRRLQQRLARSLGLIGAAVRGGTPIPRKRGYSACPDVPLIGLRLANAVRTASISLVPGVSRFTPRCAIFADGSQREIDCVILATGFRAAIEWLGAYGVRDDCGFAKRSDRVRSREFPNLYFVGHNYDGRGGLYNIAIDAKRIARLIEADQELW